MARHARSRWRRRIAVAVLVAATLTVWGAAFTAAWRCGHSPNRVTVTACPRQ